MMNDHVLTDFMSRYSRSGYDTAHEMMPQIALTSGQV